MENVIKFTKRKFYNFLLRNYRKIKNY